MSNDPTTTGNVTTVLLLTKETTDMYNDFRSEVTTSQNECSYDNRNTAKIVVETVTMCFMWTFSLIANILVCIVIHHSRRLQSTTNYFVVSLAAGDLCFTLFCIPFVLSRILAGSWLVGLAMCKIVRYVQFVVPCSTVSVLVSICMDRFYTIIYPLSFRVSRTGAKRMIIGSWFLAIVVCSPCLYFYQTVITGEKELCKTFLGDTWEGLFFILFVITTMYFIPTIAIIFVYAKISRYIWRAGNSGRRLQRTTNPVPRAKVKMVKLIMLVNACVLCLMAPYFIAHLWYSTHAKSQTDPTIYITVLWIYFATSVLKPIIYLCFNSNFRRGCKEVLCMSTMKCYRHNVYTITTRTKFGRRNHVGVAESTGTSVRDYNRVETPSKTFDRAAAIEKHMWPLSNNIKSSYL